LFNLNGVVTKIFGRHYCIADGDAEYDSFLKGKLRIDEKWKGYSNPVAVGDDINYSLNDDGTANIITVNDRKNCFSRKMKGKNTKEDIIAANLDLILIFQSFDEPRFNPRFVDRIYIRSRSREIPVVLVINKQDLSIAELNEYIIDYYKGTGLQVNLISCRTGDGIEELKKTIKNMRSLLIGYSGSGKTSLINSLIPEANLRTFETSESTGKGRHTTTNVIMHGFETEYEIIDTPGLREFGIIDIDPYYFSRNFFEFGKYASKCSFSSCTHDHEPGCYIKAMVEKGKIYEDRYISYINILADLQSYKHWQIKR
jgi:ribosome biogenesis GTPase / thiamine phosphate phosphatase